MKKIIYVAWAVRSWRYVGPVARFITRVECLHARRVVRPARAFRARGLRGPRPQLPWWHILSYRFLVLVGRLPYQRRVRPGQPRPVPRRGALVYQLHPPVPFVPSPAQQQHLVWQQFLVQQELRQSERRLQEYQQQARS
jgi:hypothetical protein